MNDLDRLERRPQQREADDDRQHADDRVEDAAPGVAVAGERAIRSKIPLTNSQAAKKMRW